MDVHDIAVVPDEARMLIENFKREVESEGLGDEGCLTSFKVKINSWNTNNLLNRQPSKTCVFKTSKLRSRIKSCQPRYTFWGLFHRSRIFDTRSMLGTCRGRGSDRRNTHVLPETYATYAWATTDNVINI